VNAISSFRKLADNQEYAANQMAACDSWQAAFDRIAYFNKYDERMDSDKTDWVESEDWPTIEQIVLYCAAQPGWSCIINADIYVSPGFRQVEKILHDVKADCALSQRYEFDPLNPTNAPAVVDLGLDIFCAAPHVWQKVWQAIPRNFRLGHSQWDSWLMAFLNTHFKDSFYNFTPTQVIYHPKHGGRKTAYDIVGMGTPFESQAYNLPQKKIG